MPVISRFLGIEIRMYYASHPPPKNHIPEAADQTGSHSSSATFRHERLVLAGLDGAAGRRTNGTGCIGIRKTD